MSKDPIKIPAVFETIDETISVIGHHDKHLKIFEDYYNVEISLRGDQLYVFGDEKKADIIRQVLLALVELHRKGKEITEPNTRTVECIVCLSGNETGVGL